MGSSRRDLLQWASWLGSSWLLEGVIAPPAGALLPPLDVCRPVGDPLAALQQGNARFAAAWREASAQSDPAQRMAVLQQVLGEHCQVDPAALAASEAIVRAQRVFFEADGFNLDIDLSAILPQGVLNSIEVLWGPQDSESTAAGISTLLGGGAFCDNTVGIAPNGSIYVIGGGPDVDTGALVQINVSGSSDSPSLEAGWYTPIRGGSATSPSISKGGQFVVISDGTGAETFFDPESVDAWVKVMDIPACDANTDADPDPAVCGVDYQQPLERDPMIGAPAIDGDGVVVLHLG